MNNRDYTYEDFVSDLEAAINKSYGAEGQVISFQSKGLHSGTINQWLEEYKEKNSGRGLTHRLYEEGAAVHLEDLPEVDEDE